MDDREIIDLYFDRSENAITESQKKYGGYCYCVAYNILGNNEDAEESVNDALMAAWNSIPPRKPSVLSVFFGRITRNAAIDRWRAQNAGKRGGGETALALEELKECASNQETAETVCERKYLADVFNRFLDTLPETERRIFLCRYWYMDPIAQIAVKFGFSQSKVTSMLHRTRGKLKAVLEKEDLL